MNNKNVYIPSIEAEEIFNLSERGLETDVNFVGMFPYSCELIKLRTMKKFGYNERKVVSKSETDEFGNAKFKMESDSIINVKFKNKLSGSKEIRSFVQGYDGLMNSLKYQLRKEESDREYCIKLKDESENERKIKNFERTIKRHDTNIAKLKGHIERIEADKDNIIYNSLNPSELREHLYVNGFTYNGNKYIFYKRTASKSRNSNALFIVESLHKPMIEWSRIGIKLDQNKKYDVASILAYESLSSSSIEDVIEIKPKNILIIDDCFSLFDRPALEVGNDLKPVPNKKAILNNNIWDGQALIDYSLMESIGKEDKGMALLRQHWFKACAFNTHIQKFFKDKHKEMTNPKHKNYDKTVNVDYDKWQRRDMFGNRIYMKDVLLVTTPSALKFLKLAEKGKEKEAYANWKQKVKEDKCLFGIVKYDKSSKYKDRQKTSYQMINTLDVSGMDDIEKLAKFEVDFIKGLQNNHEKYVQYLLDNKDKMNSHEMFAEMYRVNPEIVKTKLFGDYRKSQISKYRKKVKSGRLLLEASYTTVVANPYEMLLSAINKFDTVVSHTIKENQVYTTMYPFGYTYTAVRNPHNAMNNYFKVKNVDNHLLDTYFSFTKNIMVINNIESEICAILNGMDQDSDTTLLFKEKNFNAIVTSTLSKRKYSLIINKIDSEPDPIEFTLQNISKIDEKLAQSQRWIGKVTNLAQFLVSVIWDMQNDESYLGDKDGDIKELLSQLSVTVVLSNVAIDYAKKTVNCDIDEALRNIGKINALKLHEVKGDGSVKLVGRKKPKFWSFVTSGKPKSVEYNCPMDLLIKHIDGIAKAKYLNGIKLSDVMRGLSEEESKDKCDDKQVGDINKAVGSFSIKINKLHTEEHLNKEEKYVAMGNTYDKINYTIGKKKIKVATLHKMFEEVDKILSSQNEKETDKKVSKVNKDMQGVLVHLMNALYRNDKEKFIGMFKTIEK